MPGVHKRARRPSARSLEASPASKKAKTSSTEATKRSDLVKASAIKKLRRKRGNPLPAASVGALFSKCLFQSGKCQHQSGHTGKCRVYVPDPKKLLPVTVRTCQRGVTCVKGVFHLGGCQTTSKPSTDHTLKSNEKATEERGITVGDVGAKGSIEEPVGNTQVINNNTETRN